MNQKFPFRATNRASVTVARIVFHHIVAHDHMGNKKILGI